MEAFYPDKAGIRVGQYRIAKGFPLLVSATRRFHNTISSFGWHTSSSTRFGFNSKTSDFRTTSSQCFVSRRGATCEPTTRSIPNIKSLAPSCTSSLNIALIAPSCTSSLIPAEPNCQTRKATRRAKTKVHKYSFERMPWESPLGLLLILESSFGRLLRISVDEYGKEEGEGEG